MKNLKILLWFTILILWLPIEWVYVFITDNNSKTGKSISKKLNELEQ